MTKRARTNSTTTWISSVCFAGALLLSTEVQAFDIRTGLSDGCHEEVTVTALEAYLENAGFQDSPVPLPKTDRWKKYAGVLLEGHSMTLDSEGDRFASFSLILGARWPDEKGNSVTSFEALYANHGNPDDQYQHFLRSPHNDYEIGNVEALEAARGFIVSRMQIVESYLAKPPSEQFVEIQEYVEFYGPIFFEVWAPAYYTGAALHSLEDSFSHTIRSDDLRRVLHVMNFFDAVGDHYLEHRDGLAHSYAMDECRGSGRPHSIAAEEAATQLLGYFHVRTDDYLMKVLDDWLTYEPGCNDENNYCDSRWVEIARQDPTVPIFQSAFHCSLVQGVLENDTTFPFGIFAALLWLLLRRKSHDNAPSR